MATAGVTAQLHDDGVLVLTLAEGPSNALGPAVRAGLLAAFGARTAACRAVVLAGAGASFSSQIPTDTDSATPTLAEVCQQIEAAGLPVVAAVQGLAFGSGAALALAATARVGQRGCRIAFPEVALGLCCTGGSTRRLPRRIGAGPAIQLLTTGRVVAAEEARTLGLLDAVVEDGPVPAACALALRLADGRAGDLALDQQQESAADWQAAVAAARQANARALPAARRMIDCVEAALLLSPEAADRFEAVTRADLDASAEAAGLRAAALADRRAADLPAAVARARPLALGSLGLVGEGAGCVTLAKAALRQGIALRWLHPSVGTLAASLGLAGPGDLPAGLHLVSDLADLAEGALQVHDRAPLSRDRHALAAGAALLVLDGAEGEIGLGLAPSGRFAEVAVVPEEASQAIATALAGLRRLQIAPLLVGRKPGVGRALLRAGTAAVSHLAATGVAPGDLAAALAPFGQRPPETATTAAPRPIDRAGVAARWLGALAVAGLRLVEEGRVRRPSDIDHVLVAGYGFARWQGGPMHLADRRGLMALRRDLRLWAEENALWTPPPILDRLIRDGMTLAALDAA